MWRRFKKAMHSAVSAFVASLEDPELVLEQILRELEEQRPQMDNSIAVLQADQSALEREHEMLRADVSQLTAKVKQAIHAGQDDVAAQHATRLQIERGALERNERHVDLARLSCEKAKEAKALFRKEKERKAKGALDSLREERRSKWQSRVLEALRDFERTEGFNAQEEADWSQAEVQTPTLTAGVELVKQLKRQMGLPPSPQGEQKPPVGVLRGEKKAK